MGRPAEVSLHLRIDPVACDGVGICAHLAPDLISLDTWGYPILVAGAVTARQGRQAQRAAAGCPRRALRVEATDSDARAEG